MADDNDIIAQINDLADEEHRLRSGAGPADEARLREIEETLDQCWDLLRQRRARHEFGGDAPEPHVRPKDVVEGYRQ